MTFFTIGKRTLISLTGILLILIIISGLGISINLSFDGLSQIRISRQTIVTDFSYTILRVWVVSVIAWTIAILIGGLLNKIVFLDPLTIPAVNFVRNISPFAWFPFAIIWFGIGEHPIIFVLFITLFFPTLIAAREIFHDIPKDYIDEAKVCGAKGTTLFFRIELPLVMVQLVNLFRIIWGLGWTAVIAAEMLGTNVGLGYRLLDFRYMLFYEEMLLYIVLMGVTGVVVDYALKRLTVSLRQKLT
jgi:NitT/TauT family transport system permease protein